MLSKCEVNKCFLLFYTISKSAIYFRIQLTSSRSVIYIGSCWLVTRSASESPGSGSGSARQKRRPKQGVIFPTRICEAPPIPAWLASGVIALCAYWRIVCGHRLAADFGWEWCSRRSVGGAYENTGGENCHVLTRKQVKKSDILRCEYSQNQVVSFYLK